MTGVIISGCVFIFSTGCKLLFKQDFARRLGLKCVTCNHCTQMCKKSVTKQIDGVSRDFCSETCAKKFHDWYYKVHWFWSFLTLRLCDQTLIMLLVHWTQGFVQDWHIALNRRLKKGKKGRLHIKIRPLCSTIMRDYLFRVTVDIRDPSCFKFLL